MGTESCEKCFPKINYWFLWILIGLSTSIINAQEPAVDYRDRIVEAKAKLLKMIQKGIIFGQNKKRVFYFQ